MTGWIKLHRKLLHNQTLSGSKPYNYLSAWVYLLLIANHDDHNILFGGSIIRVGRGDIITSEVKLAAQFGWSRTKLRRFFSWLKNETMIIQKKDSKKTYITICNYNSYQNSETAKKQQKDSKKTAKKQQKNTINNDKNDKNDNNIFKEREGDADMIRKIWIRTFGRTPNILETEETQDKLIAIFGEVKTLEIMREATKLGFKNIFTLTKQLNDDGTIKPKVSDNGRGDRSGDKGNGAAGAIKPRYKDSDRWSNYQPGDNEVTYTVQPVSKINP